ncbi:LPS assembly lipoprotein LptE [Polynucleobacter victoriensis]|uniref:LPS-assembly lipoprotein LptE n=1 Tax=Polynucleobacter victoriensis TaxID=2049319 RepID=A0A212T964_9BURK|nr:LPS assembly lipoprotein LptE [Polynucleobacter victoriensis]SNC62356.1 LPS-assembly lipoprotein [Polynucleobacter victoriensis]
MKKIMTTNHKFSSKRRDSLLGGLAIFSLATLSACGWRVRGKIDLPYTNIFLSGAMTPEFRDTLEMYLKVNDINLVKSVKEADLVLEIITEQNAKQVLSYNGSGQITAYRIISRIAFRAFNPDGIELMPEADIYLTRDIDFNQANIQSFDLLVAEFVKTMRVDIVNQLMRRLSAIKKLPGKNSSKTTTSKEDQR